MKKTNFQENLKRYRIKAGYAQAKDFAHALNIGYTTYIAYESRGREPRYELLCKIANMLHVSLDDLLGRTPPVVSVADELFKLKANNSLPLRFRITGGQDDTVEFEVVSDKYPPPNSSKQQLAMTISKLLDYTAGNEQAIKFKLQDIQDGAIEFDSNSNYCLSIDKEYLINYLHELDGEKQRALQAAFIRHLNNLYSGCLWRRYGEPLSADISADIERGKVKLLKKCKPKIEPLTDNPPQAEK